MARLTSSFFVKWLTAERDAPEFPMCDFERIRYEVRPCDVLLIEGRSRVSDVIKNITQSSWSHAALYIGRLHDIEDPELRELAKQHCDDPPDTQLIIEGMLGKGTIISPLTIYDNDHIRICRPRGLSPKDAQHVLNYAVKELGKKYDVRQIFDLARLLYPWSIFPRRLRSRLFVSGAGESTKTVCSTVIAEAFASIDFPILPHVQKHEDKGLELIQRNPRLFTPRDFDYSPYFEIIKYPFIDYQSPYRDLPWNREGYISHDKIGITKTQTPDPIIPDPPSSKTDVEVDESAVEQLVDKEIAIGLDEHSAHNDFKNTNLTSQETLTDSAEMKSKKRLFSKKTLKKKGQNPQKIKNLWLKLKKSQIP